MKTPRRPGDTLCQSVQSVLVLEDHTFDQEIIERGVHRIREAIQLNMFDRVEEAISWLDSDVLNPGTAGKRSSIPDLIFLDLGLSGMYDGDRFLQKIKGDEMFDAIPLIIISNSKSGERIFDSYRFGADAYIVKPGEREAFEDAITCVVQYWDTVVRLKA